MTLFLIYENDSWLPMYEQAFQAANMPYKLLDLKKDICDILDSEPPTGVFFNKMSSSYWQRSEDHKNVRDKANALITWLISHNRHVTNGITGFAMELSKLDQIMKLRKFDIPVPKTKFIFGRQANLSEVLTGIDFPVILKPNCGGRGAIVVKAESFEEVEKYFRSYDFSSSPDNIILAQEYVKSAFTYNIRAEFIDKKLVYALKVSNQHGFQLCPADACSPNSGVTEIGKFQIDTSFRHKVIENLESFCQFYGIDVASFEFVIDLSNEAFVYDVNLNTTYNSNAEMRAGVAPAVTKLTAMLKRELDDVNSESSEAEK